jgi:hypothetical protein
MRRLVAKVVAAIDEYRRKTNPDGHEIGFVASLHEGFSVTKTTLPRVELEGRPDYEAHAVYYNMTRADDPESETVERSSASSSGSTTRRTTSRCVAGGESSRRRKRPSNSC